MGAPNDWMDETLGVIAVQMFRVQSGLVTCRVKRLQHLVNKAIVIPVVSPLEMTATPLLKRKVYRVLQRRDSARFLEFSSTPIYA